MQRILTELLDVERGQGHSCFIFSESAPPEPVISDSRAAQRDLLELLEADEEHAGFLKHGILSRLKTVKVVSSVAYCV